MGKTTMTTHLVILLNDINILKLYLIGNVNTSMTGSYSASHFLNKKKDIVTIIFTM